MNALARSRVPSLLFILSTKVSQLQDGKRNGHAGAEGFFNVKTHRKVDQSGRHSPGDGKIMKHAIFGRLCRSGMYRAGVLPEVVDVL